MSLNVRFVENTPKQCVRVFPSVLSVSGTPRRIRVMSFNLLAPCWKRTHYGRESDNDEDWNDRLTRTIPVIKEQEADIICLQEFWFHPSYQRRFLSEFHPNYHVFVAQRGGQKPDGLALLLKASLFPVGQHRCLDYHDFGFRIAQVVQLPGMVIVNTHFTFPHATRYDPILRKQQAEKLSRLLRSLGDTPIILCGDFNGNIDDDAVAMLLQQSKLNPMYNHSDFISHRSHRGEDMACDFVMISDPLSFISQSVHPLNFDISDHALVSADILWTETFG